MGEVLHAVPAIDPAEHRSERDEQDDAQRMVDLVRLARVRNLREVVDDEQRRIGSGQLAHNGVFAESSTDFKHFSCARPAFPRAPAD